MCHVMFTAGEWLYFDSGGGGCIFGSVFHLLLRWDIFLLLGRIWGYVHLQKYHSFVISVCLNYICKIVQVYLVIGLSFQCVVFLMFVRFCHVCFLCRVYVGRILSCLFFMAWIYFYTGL
jgi:hypothetical protein